MTSDPQQDEPAPRKVVSFPQGGTYAPDPQGRVRCAAMWGEMEACTARGDGAATMEVYRRFWTDFFDRLPDDIVTRAARRQMGLPVPLPAEVT